MVKLKEKLGSSAIYHPLLWIIHFFLPFLLYFGYWFFKQPNFPPPSLKTKDMPLQLSPQIKEATMPSAYFCGFP